MARSKTELFDAEIQKRSEYFKALAHPARIAIILHLAETGTCITRDISHALPLSRTTVNQHLSALKKAKIIQGHPVGVNTKYCIDPGRISNLRKVTAELLDLLKAPETLKC